MHDIFPRAEIEAKFGKPLLVVQRGLESYDTILRDEEGIGGLALNVWNRITEVEKMPFDPYAIRPYLNPNGQPKKSLLPAIDQIIGSRVIKDISCTYATVEDPDLEDNEVGKLVIANVFPNDLHLADVTFQNPYRPIPQSRQRYTFTFFEGFKMLGPTLERIEAAARRLGCQHVTLTCAAPDLIPLFSKFGFRQETGPFGSRADAMEKKLGN